MCSLPHPRRPSRVPGAGSGKRRVLVMVPTNVGGSWAVPTVRSLVEGGHDVLAVVGSEPGTLADMMTAAGASVRQMSFAPPWRPLRWLATYRSIAAMSREHQADTMLYYLYTAAIVGRAVGLVRRIPTVHYMVSPLVLETPPLSWAERVLLRFDRHIIAGSEAIRVALGHLGRRKRISVVYPPIDTTRLAAPDPATRAEARASPEVQPHAFVAVMVAYWYAPRKIFRVRTSLKGHDLAVEAWRLSNPGPDDRLYVVGGGFRDVGRQAREQFLAAYDRDGNPTVRFVDHTDDVALYYSAADVSVAPSSAENLGSAAEAAVAGVPSIATRVGGFPEIVVPGFSGWLLAERTAECLREAIADARAAKQDGRLQIYSVNARALADVLLDQQNNADASASITLGAG